MPRIVGVDVPNGKRIEYALTYVFGIGLVTSREILEKAKIDLNTRAKDLTEAEVGKINTIISDTVRVEGDLKREITANIKRLTSIGSYRGLRHRRGLPVRGQRTKTNARTRKGPKRTMAGKKKK